ncbi:MAG: DUF3795 domain-containing protein [Euryarchaeota archaeon]|nr:DUF3795 domain-containing protein [Euryarchaeota archaeon]
MSQTKNDLIGACGIYCGLCTRYQSRAKSRCIGCKVTEMHSWCSIWNCCVKKYGFGTCADCREYPCERYERRLAKYPEDLKTAQENLDAIKKSGLDNWLKGQRERRLLVENLRDNYNDGRSMSFYCKVCTVLPVEVINNAIEEARGKIVSNEISDSDMKSRARILKAIIQERSLNSGINVKLMR